MTARRSIACLFAAVWFIHFRCIRNHERALVEVFVEKEMCLELYSNCKAYGRVVLREKSSTIGVGLVTKIL